MYIYILCVLVCSHCEKNRIELLATVLAEMNKIVSEQQSESAEASRLPKAIKKSLKDEEIRNKRVAVR